MDQWQRLGNWTPRELDARRTYFYRKIVSNHSHSHSSPFHLIAGGLRSSGFLSRWNRRRRGPAYARGSTLTEIRAAYNSAMRWKGDHPSPPRERPHSPPPPSPTKSSARTTTPTPNPPSQKPAATPPSHPSAKTKNPFVLFVPLRGEKDPQRAQPPKTRKSEK